MITLTGPAVRCCDRVRRRSFLQIGGLTLGGLGGLSLPQLLAAEQQAGVRRGHKAVISVLLAGGLSHIDTFDLKPDAAPEFRGEFRPIRTNIPGIRISELLPLTARIMDRLALVRSITGMRDEHSSFQNLTGAGMNETLRQGLPNFGSVVARLLGPTHPTLPAFVDLFPEMKFKPYNSPGPGKLGPAFAGLKVDGEDLAGMKLRFVEPGRFADRRRLLAAVNGLQQAVHDDRRLETLYGRAFDVLATSRIADAVDVSLEEPKVRERYGRGSSEVPAGGGPLWNEQFLMARRLVEAGARCVTIAYGGWDTHKHNFVQLRKDLPLMDRALSALVNDIHERGLADDVTVVVWGEFGRTPKINNDAGRDHWAPVNFCLLAGGGLRTGQVIGSTDATAAAVKDRPVHFHDVFATVYRNLGISPHAMATDLLNRPTPILPGAARPIAELI